MLLMWRIPPRSMRLPKLTFLLSLLLLICVGATSYLPHRRKAFRVVAGGVAKDNLVAWYDFADGTDSHTGGYDLTEVASPSYNTSGDIEYGTATDATPDLWTQDDVDNIVGDVDEDFTIVIRVRGYGSISEGDWLFRMNNSRNGIRFRLDTDQMDTLVADFTPLEVSTTIDIDTWYVVVAQWDSSETRGTAWVDNGNETSEVQAGEFGSGILALGGFFSTTGADVDIDYFGLFERLLTSDERTAIYNAGGTFEYADFD